MGIRFDNVTYRYESGRNKIHLGLDALQLELREGCITAVLGAPGSGKSTLIQHMNGLLLPHEGAVIVREFRLEPELMGTRALARKSKQSKVPIGLRKTVGLVFQFPEQQLFEETVLKELCFGPLNFGVSEADAVVAAREAAAAMGLSEELLERSPFELSDGQMRKTAIAAVLSSHPDIIVLDEPTASLDQISRRELMQLLHRLCREQGKTIVIVTHHLEEVMRVADDYIVMSEGRTIFQGGAGAMLRDFDQLEAAGIVPPPSIKLLRGIAERWNVPLPERFLDAEEAASWIVEELEAGRRMGRGKVGGDRNA
jgi:energy-coupling factor transport system ATP-binding protein